MDHRPNPDELLARVAAEERQQSRGKLKIFFGATAGVGKTYAMLEAAHEQAAAGVDVLAGWVDTHGRAETAALLDGLTLLPRRQVEYRGATLEEFDLDGALARRPQLILVDELAHSNAPGARHRKRYQDVEELLAAGVDVFSTVNVQHIESLNDVVAQITGVVVRETVPDRILEQADEIELIDLTPDDLLQRLKEGKVYVPQQAERAVENFFRKGNLIALRELAVQRTADHINTQMQGYRHAYAIAETWPTNEHLLVAVGPDERAPRLVRAGRRMAARLRARWIVVYVETAAHQRLSDVERDRLVQALRLAEQLGAETVTLSGQRVSAELLAYARVRNAARIVVGKPQHARWKDVVFGSVVDDLVRRGGEIDVYVISGDDVRAEPAPALALTRTSPSRQYGAGLAVVALCTALAWLMFPFFDLSNLIMVYLVGVIVAATRFGRGPAVMASIASVAAFDVFFVPPYYTFAVSDAQYLVTFGVMLAVALVISTLAARLRQQAGAALRRERRSAALYALSRSFAGAREAEQLLRAAVVQISETFASQVVVLLPNSGGRLQAWGPYAGWWGRGMEGRMIFAPNANEQGVAQWVYDHREPAGWSTTTLAGAEALYVPLIATRGAIGVLGVRPAARATLPPEQLHLLETFANQTALALERAQLADEAEGAQVEIRAERLRNSLLSSVSHDLRTPIASIAGAASTMIEGAGLQSATRHELAQSIYDEAERLNRLVGNLLDMTRLEAGAVQVRKEWQPLEEVIGVVLARLDERLSAYPLDVRLPPDLPPVPLDGVLIEQVLLNLLDNATKYAPPGSPITVSAEASSDAVTVSVADRGPGIPPGDEQRIFEKFYRSPSNSVQGSGLGLAICRGIITAHGGHIWATNSVEGGAVVQFTIPLDTLPPSIGVESEGQAAVRGEMYDAT